MHFLSDLPSRLHIVKRIHYNIEVREVIHSKLGIFNIAVMSSYLGIRIEFRHYILGDH